MNDLPTLFEVMTGRKTINDKPSMDLESKSLNGVKVEKFNSLLFTIPTAKLVTINNLKEIFLHSRKEKGLKRSFWVWCRDQLKKGRQRAHGI